MLGNALSGYGLFGGEAQRNQTAYNAEVARLQQMQSASTYLTYSGTGSTVFTLDCAPSVGGSFTAKPDTALDWLDRRIDEIRVKL